MNTHSLFDFTIVATQKLILLGLSIGAIAVIVGIIYQIVSEAIDRHKYPPKGQLIDIGGHRLYFNCIGQGTPTVIMETGSAASSILWGLIPNEIAQFTSVCTYDRAGFGWSDPNLTTPRTSQESVNELHILLTKAGIKPPYILVGHSLGGANVQLYASQYPEDVIGLVLVDSVHENQMTLESQRHIKKQVVIFQVMGIVCQIGLLRLLGELNLLKSFKGMKQEFKKYPLAVQGLFDIYKSYYYRPHHWATASNEHANAEKSFEQLRSIRSLGNVPLIVLSQGVKHPKMSDEYFQKWRQLQIDLNKLSDNSQHIIAEKSGHQISLDQPDLVISSIRQLVERARSQSNQQLTTSN